MTTDVPILPFVTARVWRAWLSKNYEERGIWVRLYKKASGVQSVTYAEALDEALCFGWIDGQVKSLDEKSYIQKFTPRGARSMWSKKNRENIARLTKEGKMMPSGKAAVEAAQKDGRWESAYDSPATMKIPADFLEELEKRPKAKQFFSTLNRTNVYAICWRLQTATKVETRTRRMQAVLEKLEKGEKLHD